MKNNRVLLLRTLLLSTSQFNKLKYCKDRKKRGQVIGNLVGMSVLFVVLMGYCILMSVGYGMIGLTGAIPAMCALVISVMAFFFTIFKTNGYLFNFKEYDMLMSLPFEAKTVAADKFLYMYVKSLPWYVSISLAMMVGYGIFASPSPLVYPVWLILGLVLPIIPMLFASFVGFLIAKVSAGFRKTNIIQTVLIFAFMIFCFSLRFIAEGLVKNQQVEMTLEKVSSMTDGIGKLYWPVKWFTDAVTEQNIVAFLLLVGVTALLFELIFIPVGRSYRKINSALKSHAASRTYRLTGQKQRTVWNAIAFKEFKRLLGSTTYMTNGAMGEVLAFLSGIVVLVAGIDQVIETVTQGAPVSKEMLYPAIPFIVYFLIGMVSTTTCSPSLEGKNYWIVQSLPIEKKVLYQGKMLFNLYLTVPFSVFATLCFCISARTPVVNAILYLIEGIVLCGFSTAWGCVCGISHMKLDWENEIEVVKQGAAVSIYLLSNLFGTMILLVLVVFLGLHINPNLVTVILTAVAALLTVLSYRKVLKLIAREA